MFGSGPSSLLLALLVGAVARPAAAQPVQVLHRFTPSTAHPNGPLVQCRAATSTRRTAVPAV